MASRENQTLQGFIIALSILLVLMFVALYMVNNARVKEQARANDASQRETEARRVANDAQSEANNYKRWMGFREEDSLETVQKSFDEDMLKYGSSYPEDVRFYSSLLQYLHGDFEKLTASEAKAKEDIKSLAEQLNALKAERDKQFAEYDAQLKKLSEDAAAQRGNFTKDRDEANAEKDKLAQKIREQREEIDKANADRTAAEKQLADEIGKLTRDVEILKHNVADPDPFAQPADGLVRWVNQKEQKVWINVGEADHLRPQVTFSVYSGDESDALKAETKGSIEVIKILGPHMAEARISSDVPTRPLMEGDKIYSQVWNRGRQVGFAIAGVIDMDGDGKSDLDELKSVIALNSGKVDALPGTGGTVEGEMTVDTRYLILGKFPEDTLQDADNQRRAWEKMTENADRLGIETITLDEFLNLMGWKADQRAIALGAEARADDFPPQPQGEYKIPRSTTGGSTFRPRKPQPTY